MTDATYNVIFAGQIVNGADPAKVRDNVAKLFRMDGSKIEALFSGKRVVVKKQADQAAAMKLRAMMKQAGAVCELEKIGDAAPAATPPADSTPARAVETASTIAGTSATAAERSGSSAATSSDDQTGPQVAAAASAGVNTDDLQTVGTIRTGGTGFSGPFEVAPSGADLVERRDGPAPIVPDISHLTMAEAGADLGQKKSDQEIKVPDISHISVAAPGADLSGQ